MRSFIMNQFGVKLPKICTNTISNGNKKYSVINRICNELFLLGFYTKSRKYFEIIFILYHVSCEDCNTKTIMNMKYSDFD
jgi:hypothetical protein